MKTTSASLDLDPFNDSEDDVTSDFDTVCDIFGVKYSDPDMDTVEKWLDRELMPA